MENCEAMTSLTHSFAFINSLICIHIDWSRNVSLKITKIKLSYMYMYLIFYPIYIKFSLFCMKMYALYIELVFKNLDQRTFSFNKNT